MAILEKAPKEAVTMAPTHYSRFFVPKWVCWNKRNKGWQGRRSIEANDSTQLIIKRVVLDEKLKENVSLQTRLG